MITFNLQKNSPIPFWWWNGVQEEHQLTAQLEEIAEAGLRGVVIHPRYGNQIDYLSELWMDHFRHACREAKRLGLEVWLYDDESYPSGSAARRIPKQFPHYRQKSLVYSYMTVKETEGLEQPVLLFTADDLSGPVSGEDLEPERKVLAFSLSYVDRYVDTLDPEVIRIFMDMTHEAYLKKMPECFGSPVTHVYTDDLNYFLRNDPAIPYTDAMFDKFKSKYGYSLEENLPKLVENIPGCEKIRFDFNRFVLQLFLDACVIPMLEWCHEQGVKLTGHLSGDEGPAWKTIHRFGAQMPFHMYEDLPGVDEYLCARLGGRYLDGLRNKGNWGSIPIFKKVSSVANQLKEGKAGSEVLTFMGWGISLAEQTSILAWQEALGVNILTHHTFSYATAGIAKRDCPASYFIQQPYWPVYHILMDQYARTTELLLRGTYDASVLVLYPSASMWIAKDGRGIDLSFKPKQECPHPFPDDLEDGLAVISRILLQKKVGFEYGDETIIETEARIEDNMFCIGSMKYSTVIIPQVSCLYSSTLDLLDEFIQNGGRVIAVSPGECLVDGEKPEQSVWEGVLADAEVCKNPEDLAELDLEQTLDAGIHLPDNVVCHTRLTDSGREHYLVNAGGEDARITGEFSEESSLYDPYEDRVIFTGTALPGNLIIPARHTLHILPSKTMKGNETADLSRTVFCSPSGSAEEIPETEWSVQAMRSNLMLVDWRTDSKGDSFFYHEQENVDSLPVYAEVVIPDPAAVTSLLCERHMLDALYFNGTQLIELSAGTHPASHDFALIDLGGHVRQGKNVIEMKKRYVPEPLYLQGEFTLSLQGTGREARPVIQEIPLAMGNLARGGLPFYWGTVKYSCAVQLDENAAKLDCGRVDGVLSCSVNGKECGVRMFAPFIFDIRDAVQPGEENTIELTLYNTAQNLFGKHRPGMKWRAYIEELEDWCRESTDYTLAPFGIHGKCRVQ